MRRRTLSALLDVNVLMALAWPNHVHHDIAIEWFRAHQRLGWATCPITQSVFVRLSSNARLTAEARSPREALELLRRITALPDHLFWPNDIALADTPFLAADKLVGYRQITDAHLLAVALRHGGRLATLDDGVRSVVPAPHEPAEVVCLLTEDRPT